MPQTVQTALASFSAANWIAPYARTTTQFFYAEKRGLDHIQSGLKLSSTAKGENVIITIPKDQGVFLDAYEPAPGVRCTSPIQTYPGPLQGRRTGRGSCGTSAPHEANMAEINPSDPAIRE